MSVLTVPSGYSTAEARGHAGTGKVVGTAWKADHREGVLWSDGIPTVLPQPRSTPGSNYPRAINTSGVIAGYWVGNDGTTSAWRYQNGRYQFLPGIGTQTSVPTAINDNGDIAGFSRYFMGGAKTYAVMWRTDHPDTLVDFGEGYSEGIDNSRRVVLSTGAMVDGEGREVMRLQGGQPLDYRGGRIVGYAGSSSPYTIVEWGLDGKIVRQLPGGVPSEVNSSGIIVGTRTGGSKSVWRDGGTEDLTGPVPTGLNMLGITDDGAVISDYQSGGGTRSGIWRRSC
ncbi:hypothetical protein [Streptomyces sp. NBC_01233]|uniref:hypothetical protein n=1 Tax=Streptomyces sp. NBC_01233 TaxID=2903787 RepID=UPI002E0EEEE6|nr:hypothetical protein OG332_41570 [Streptomyces sp. NBC_01233]